MKLKNTNHKLNGTLIRTSVDELKSYGIVQVPTTLPQSKGGIVIRIKDVSVKRSLVNRTPRFGPYGRIVPLLHTSYPGVTKMMTRKEVDKLRKKGVRVRIVGSVFPSPSIGTLQPGMGADFPVIPQQGTISVLASPEGGGGRVGGSSRIERAKGRLATRFYGSRKSRKEKLEELLLVVVELEKQIKNLIEEEDNDKGSSDMPPPSTGLFKEYVNEESLAECFHQMYNDKARTEALHGKFGKDIDFVALLYVLVVDYKMGSKKLGVKPFHEFFEKYVLNDEQKIPCYKTMANRLNLQFQGLLKWAQTKNGIQILKNCVQNDAEKNYLTVRGIFHETKYYKQIKCFLRK